MTLLELATETKNLARPSQAGYKFSTAHEVAAVMHGWNSYEHHFGPVDLTKDQYLKALECALRGEIHSEADRKRR